MFDAKVQRLQAWSKKCVYFVRFLFSQLQSSLARVTCIYRQRLFTFQVSECFCNTLIINSFNEWNFAHEVSLLISSLHFASLAPRFEIFCTMFWNLLHHVLKSLAPCFWNETLKAKMKHKNAMFHVSLTYWLSTRLIKKWNMKAKILVDKMYVGPNAYFGHSETFCRGFCRGQ